MISDEVEQPHCIRLQPAYTVWNNRVFRIPKKVILVEQEMKQERVQWDLFEPAWCPYTNAHFLVAKTNGMYRFMIIAMSAN